MARSRLPLSAQGFLIVACCLGVIVLGWSVFKTRFYRAAIPAKIDLTFGFATTGSNMSLWEAMLPLRPKACGGAIFGLSNTMVTALQDHGLGVLDAAHQGRGYADTTDRRFFRYSYKPWQPTPLPPEWTSQGAWYGLNCMDLGYGFVRSLVEAAQVPGSFYTTGPSSMLLIVPSLQILVYTYTS